ncbi:DEHA2G19976p [Debaryomyces hansenii CBS767]|uniref:DEHA2G19976p n=1 Tax=Debaryomyces hansenii (strain ATCC 36239 / CBS 767 / BCRC 21394 / JCM 1990 / NBRC 0083 / IGC 2968) TaxID=284592 RepID=Q6BHA9_DEBHA|nr:DEHA2G19976p [Debaryomyces hansenii CBS767]CAG90921.2 DEHA2G19976p [Debaryomyces hansenii CBS767]|eukprot:XP_462412.2 DEHA2G19976p [Debaryomyces hansenii CBS767]
MLRTINRAAYGIRLTQMPVASRTLQWHRFYTKDVNNDQIFIHPIADSKFKVSLSPKENALPLGYSKNEKISTTNFDDNDEFLSVLHSNIASNVHNDFAFIVEAGTFANSYMPIYDFREIPSYSRVPEVDNIFGYVHVNGDGKIIPGSYEPNSMYRLCNGAGLPRLSDHIYDLVRQKCETTN